MFKLALRNLWHRRIRFLLIVSVAALSISLPTATTIFGDNIFDIFDDISSPTAGAIDFIIKEDYSFYSDQADSQQEFENDYFGRQKEEFLDDLQNTIYIDEALLTNLAELESIEFIAGTVEKIDNRFQIIKTTDGEERLLEWGLDSDGIFNVSHTEHESFNEYSIISGNPPSAADEIVLDASEATDKDIAIGDTVRLEDSNSYVEYDLLPGEKRSSKEFKVVGFAEVKAEGRLAKFIQESVAVNVFHIDGLRQLLDYPPDKLDVIKIKLSQADPAHYHESGDIDLNLPEHAQRRYGFSYKDAIPKYSVLRELGDLQIAIDSYVGLAIFISVFVIFNIFNAVLKQQTRETALLRAVGLTRFAILRLVAIKSLILGFLAVLAGLAIGIGLGYLLVELSPGLLEFADVDIGFKLRWQAFISPAVFGLVAIFAAGLWPALRASRLKPLEALAATSQPSELSKWRVIIGLALLTIAGAVVAVFVINLKGNDANLFQSANYLLLIGILLIIASLMLLPIGVRLCITAIGRLLRPIIGNNTALVLGNINRQLGQMSTNVSALVVCMILIVISTVLLHSLTISFKNNFETTFSYDYYTITDLPSDIVTLEEMKNLRLEERLGDLNIVDGRARLSYSTLVVVGADEKEAVLLTVADIENSDTAYMPGRFDDNRLGKNISGSELDNLKKGEIIISEFLAEKNNWQVGQSVNLAYIDINEGINNEHEYVIGGTIESEGFYSDDLRIIMDRNYFLEHADNKTAVSRSWIAFNVREEVGLDETFDITEEISDENSLSPLIFDKENFQRNIDEQYLESLGEIGKTAIPALMIVFWGLASTLSLAVFERTREIGILRALGFNRRQIQATITAEAVTTAFLAVSIAGLLGILLAWGIYKILISDLVAANALEYTSAVFSIPWGIMFIYLGVNLILAMIASLWPAIRAGRLDIVDSITKS